MRSPRSPISGARSSSTSTSSTTTSSGACAPRRSGDCSTTCLPGTGSGCSHWASTAARSCTLTGPAAPHIMDGVSPELRRQGHAAPHQRVQPGRQRAHHQLDRGALPHRRMGRAGVTPSSSPRPRCSACGRRSRYVCRLDDRRPDRRLDARGSTSSRRWPTSSARCGSISLHFQGPGRISSVGLFAGSRWQCAPARRPSTGSPHAPNLPTEEVFTTPDPGGWRASSPRPSRCFSPGR